MSILNSAASVRAADHLSITALCEVVMHYVTHIIARVEPAKDASQMPLVLSVSAASYFLLNCLTVCLSYFMWLLLEAVFFETLSAEHIPLHCRNVASLIMTRLS